MPQIDWRTLLQACSENDCRGAQEFLSNMCSEPGLCWSPRKRGPGPARYAWIEAILRRGVPDGRARLILYVISRYLVNLKGLSDGEAIAEINAFIEASCRNYGNCGKIYQSWIRNVIRHVRRGGWKPWSLERMRRDDPELYSIVEKVAGARIGEEEEQDTPRD